MEDMPKVVGNSGKLKTVFHFMMKKLRCFVS